MTKHNCSHLQEAIVKCKKRVPPSAETERKGIFFGQLIRVIIFFINIIIIYLVSYYILLYYKNIFNYILKYIYFTSHIKTLEYHF